MQNSIFRKTLVLGIIVLFIGAGVFPVTGIRINNELVENKNIVESQSTNDPISNAVDWWPMFHHDLNNSGYSSSLYAPQTPTVKWNFRANFLVFSSPAVVNGKVYFGSDDENFYCLDAESGKAKWNYYIPGGTSISSPCVVDGRVYIGTTYDYIYCFDAGTGGLKWRFYKGYGGCTSPSVYNDKVYVSFSNDNNKPKVCCLDARTGNQIWNRSFADGEIGHVAVYEGNVYVPHLYGMLYYLDGETGDIIWEKYTGGKLGAPAIYNDKVYVTANGITCLDPDTGKEIWRSLGTWSHCSPSIAYNKVYYVSSNGKILCIDADTGDELWSYDIGSTYEHAFPSPAIADEKVYVGIWSSGDFLCLDAFTGDIIWTKYVGGAKWLFSSPAIVNGRVYMTASTHIYCFEDPSTPPSDPLINGPNECILNFGQKFRFKSTDPEGDKIKYFIDWGDGATSGWVGPYYSGEEIEKSHIWDETGSFIIRAIAKDSNGIKGHWSEHKITVIEAPVLEIQVIRGGLFRAKTVVKNIGSKDALDVKWNITLAGGLILLGRESSGTIDCIPVGGDANISTDFIFGFGPVAVHVDAMISFGLSDTRLQSGSVFLFFVRINPGRNR